MKKIIDEQESEWEAKAQQVRDEYCAEGWCCCVKFCCFPFCCLEWCCAVQVVLFGVM